MPSDPMKNALPVRSTAIALVLSASLAGCVQADPPSPADGGPAPVAQPTANSDQPANDPQANTQKDPAMTDMATFVPAGAKLLDSKQGDLRGDGSTGALLVIDPPSTGREMLGEGSPRTVVLLGPDASGALSKQAENAKIVPCARCGGLAGDPYAFSRIEKGGFMISTSGGSRERWADDFTFRYSSDQGAWILEKATRQVTDTVTNQTKTLDLGGKEFGVIRFESFDPSTLPKVGALSGEGTS